MLTLLFGALLILGCLLPMRPALAVPHEIRWRLGRSDFLRYERRTVTLKIGKEAFYRQLKMPLDEAYAYASTVMVENMLHAEAEEVSKDRIVDLVLAEVPP